MAVEATAQVIVACELTPAATGVQVLSGLVEQIQQHLWRKPTEFSVDAGYSSEANLRFLGQKGIEVFIPSTRQRHTTDVQQPASRGRIPQRLTRRQRIARKLLALWGRARYAPHTITIGPVFGEIYQAPSSAARRWGAWPRPERSGRSSVLRTRSSNGWVRAVVPRVDDDSAAPTLAAPVRPRSVRCGRVQEH